jgi:hypothetical protein
MSAITEMHDVFARMCELRHIQVRPAGLIQSRTRPEGFRACGQQELR